MNTIQRSLSIETLRGLACLLLVFYHVIGPVDGGLKLGAGTGYRLISDALVDVRMPLFTFISGFIFSMQSTRHKPVAAFMLGKARRILMPLVFVGLPISLAQALGPGVNKDTSITDAILSVVFPINHFWFLNAIFLIFFVARLLLVTEFLKDGYHLLIVFLLAAVLFLGLSSGPHFFAMDGAIYLGPFFVIGIATERYFPILRRRGRLLACLGVAILLTFQLYVASHHREIVIDRRSALALVVGVSACILLYGCGFQSRLLALIGGYSFGIYLFHTLFAVSVRTTLTRFGVESTEAFVVLELAAGLLGPILLTRMLTLNPLLASMFLGEPRKQTRPSPGRALAG
jgi:peptidoglycan/LPS O-acetylase OafA/YrhL